MGSGTRGGVGRKSEYRSHLYNGRAGREGRNAGKWVRGMDIGDVGSAVIL